MSRVLCSHTVRGRAAVFSCLIVLPFLAFLVRHGYGIGRPESLALTGLLIAISVFLALATPLRLLFYTAAGVMIGLSCAAPIADLSALPLPASILIATLLATAAALLLGETLLPAVAAVALAALVTALPMWQVTRAEGSPRPMTLDAAAPVPAHVLYMILDEHLGLSAFPEEIAGCGSAARAVTGALIEHGFSVYPNAYSNYPVTVDSLPSVLNRTVLPHSRKMIRKMTPDGRVYALSDNRLVRSAIEAGRAVFLVEHRSLRLAPPELEGAVAGRLEYEDDFAALAGVDGSWIEKAKWLVGAYEASDPALRKVNRFLPFRIGHRITGPLAIRGVWPRALAEEIVAARRPTLFLAHLLSPHGPYLYRRDGAIRPIDEWADDRADRRLTPAAYRNHYERYCEQVEFAAGELKAFLDALRASGRLASMTVVIHGDHGSRIRAEFPAAVRRTGADSSPERMDYPGEPGLRDLLDRFSVLAAIKRPGQAAARVHLAKESLLRILDRDFYDALSPELAPNPAKDLVYLFSPIGESRPIAILDYWR